jgi:6-phosphogluconate dehydrogenase (decarboxylating)
MALLQQARQLGCKVALATMARCQQANRVLAILDLEDTFDFVATRDDEDSYAAKLLAAMRNQFGGHAVEREE